MANNWKINKTVDLARGIDGVEVWPHALLVTGDENAHEWNVTVMDNGKPASLGGSIRAYFVRSDGATVTATGSVAGNVATVTLPEACYAYEGDLQAVMQLIQDDVSVTLSALLLRVRQISTDVIVDPGTEIPSLDDLLAQIESMKQATKDANAATTNANQAATDAETRVDEAISDAEDRVDTAVQSAETATSKANASATAADASKEAADTAANAANEAADRANKAASGVGIRKKIVDVLPAKAEMEQDVLYLVRRAEPNAENVYDEYMLINGEVEAIGSTKTDLEDYATKDYVGEQIGAIEIGGRNLILDTELSGKTSNFDYIINKNVITWNVANPIDKWNILNFTMSEYGLSVIRNKYITISFEYKINRKLEKFKDQEGMCLAGCEFDINYTDNSVKTEFVILPQNIFPAEPSEWIKFFKTIKIEDKSIKSVVPVLLFKNATGEFSIRYFKIEIGNKATDWSPAPEDLDAKIDGIDIGGRNYIFNSSELFVDCLDAEPGSRKEFQILNIGQSLMDILDGTNVMLSFDLEMEVNTDNPSLRVYDASYVGPKYIGSNYLYFDANKGSKIKQRCHIATTITDRDDNIVTDKNHNYIEFFTGYDTSNWYRITNIKVELGNEPTDWSPAPEDIYRRAAVTYDFGGRNLKRIFGTPEALKNALNPRNTYGDIYISNISVGDYWPITLNGTFWDWGSYTVKSNVPYYSNNTLQNRVGTTETTYEGTYVSETAVSFSLSGTTYYVRTTDCLPYFERTFNNVSVELEVAAINHYFGYGDSNNINKPHLVFVSRYIPYELNVRMRKKDEVWEEPDTQNPYLGSALFKTLNDSEHGVVKLIKNTELEPYIYTGKNGKGMEAMLEKKPKGEKEQSGFIWTDRGVLFLPSEAEIWGSPLLSDPVSERGLSNQYDIFRGSMRHITMKYYNKVSPASWWSLSTVKGSSTQFAYVLASGVSYVGGTGAKHHAPICFLFA